MRLASSVVLTSLFMLGACANGSTSNFTQAPIFFSDGSLEDPVQTGEAATYVTADGNALLPLGREAALTPGSGSSVGLGSNGAPGGIGAGLPSTTVTVSSPLSVAGLAELNPSASATLGANPSLSGGVEAGALGGQAAGVGLAASGSGLGGGVSVGGSPVVQAAVTPQAGPVAFAVNASVLGGAATVNTAPLSAASGLNPSLVTSAGKVLCIPSVQRKC